MVPMSETERAYQRYIDEMILNSSREELEKIQKLDRDTQLSGGSFYDLFSRRPDDAAVVSTIRPGGRDAH